MNLATTNKNDFTVNQDGGAFISQRKVAELTGIPRATIQDWIKANPAIYNINENNQLDAKSLQNLAFSGHSKGYEKCLSFIELLAEAGAKAFIYTGAGYTIQAANDPIKLEPLAYIDKLLLAQKMLCDDLRIPDSGRLQL
jgi:hypothetical protein